MTAVYVIREDNHKILYYNKRVREVAPNIEIGMVCHELWKGTCENCPLLYIGDKKEARTVNYDDPFGKAVEIAWVMVSFAGGMGGNDSGIHDCGYALCRGGESCIP